MTNQSAQEFGFMSSPPSWYEVAKQLHEQAAVLFENKRNMIYFTDSNGKQTARSTANRSLFLLTGFATENMIKRFSFMNILRLSRTAGWRTRLKPTN